LLDCARFWLDKGVDGFRLDAINYTMHDLQLRDNPPAANNGRPFTRPVDYQQPLYNKSQPDMLRFLERIRRLTDSYAERFTVAEIGGDDPESDMHSYTEGQARLHTAYGFNFLYAEQLTPALVRKALQAWPATEGTGWPSWAFSNHDAPRAVSRWAAPEHRADCARLAMLLLVTLRGNIFLYQGEELGLAQAQIGYADLQDPEAIANWPRTLGRDGARTPMPWRAEATQAGFTTGKPWLPISAEHVALAVDGQQREPGSQLALTRRLLALRNHNDALRIGAQRFLDAPDPLLAFERTTDQQQLLCLFNLGANTCPWPPRLPGKWRIIEQVGEGQLATLGPFAGLVASRLP
jgi:alpha-glucosidase